MAGEVGQVAEEVGQVAGEVGQVAGVKALSILYYFRTRDWRCLVDNRDKGLLGQGEALQGNTAGAVVSDS